MRIGLLHQIERYVFKAQGSRKKVSVLASSFPALKITPPAGKNYSVTNARSGSGLGPHSHTRSQRAVSSETENQFALQRGGEAATEQRDAGTLSKSAREPRGRRRGVLLAASAPRERGLGVRAHTRRLVSVGTPRGIPHQAEFRESRKQVCPGVSPRPSSRGLLLHCSGPRATGPRWEGGAGLRCTGSHSAARFCDAAAAERGEEGWEGRDRRGGCSGVFLGSAGGSRRWIPAPAGGSQPGFPAASRPPRLPGEPPPQRPHAARGSPGEHPAALGAPEPLPGRAHTPQRRLRWTPGPRRGLASRRGIPGIPPARAHTHAHTRAHTRPAEGGGETVPPGTARRPPGRASRGDSLVSRSVSPAG